MSVMNEMVLTIQHMAHDMGDDFGVNSATVIAISQSLKVPETMVRGALDPEYVDETYYNTIEDPEAWDE